jgi:predicted SAM-dependent methyltransferase
MNRIRLYLGCAMPPFHEQHLEIMGNPGEWLWVDKFIDHPNVKKWDAELLTEVEDSTVEKIYASHLVEHFPHPKVPGILRTWYKKLKVGGELLINVPDMRWIAEQVLRYDSGQMIESEHYYEWEGEHGMQQIIYGSHAHSGEIHSAGFTKATLTELLEKAGFSSSDIDVKRNFDAHDMGILFAKAQKR